MSKASSDERLARLALAAAQARGETEMWLHYRTCVNVTALNGLITADQQTAFDNMDPKYVHPRRIKLLVSDVATALP